MTLLQYARFYESIYNMPSSDKPEADVIDNDAELDQWYEKYTREISRRLAQATGRKGDLSMDNDSKFSRLATFGGASGGSKRDAANND